MRSRFTLMIIGALLFIAALDGVYQDTGALVPQSREAQLAALLSAYSEGSLALDQPSKTADCAVSGALPDHDCTPGAVFADATPAVICASGYSASVRDVSVSLKKWIYASYGLSYPQPRGAYEVDHLIPLELGGSNDASNLFPEPAMPVPGFHEKDLVEDYLHQEVCAGTIDLAAAQKQIATDWIAVYSLLSPQQILELKQRYKNWSSQ